MSNSSRLSDILDDQIGIFIVPDFGGGNGIQIQGLDSEYTLLLVDGYPIIGRQSGTLDLERIAVGNIEKVYLDYDKDMSRTAALKSFKKNTDGSIEQISRLEM